MECSVITLHQAIIVKDKSLIRVVLYLFLVFYCLPSPLDAQSQNRYFNHITVDDGLLANLVRDIYQDSKGFIWLTNDTEGILKYDGYRFTPYTNLSSYQSSSLVSWPYSIADIKGLIWTGTRNGVDILDPETDKFLHYLPVPFEDKLVSKNAVYKIFTDRQDVIWIGTRDGLIRLKEKEGVQNMSFEVICENGMDSIFNIDFFRIFPGDTIDPVNRILSIYEDRYENLMVAGTMGLFVFHRQKEMFIRIDDDAEGKSRLCDTKIWGIQEDPYGNYWIATTDGVCRMQNFNSFIDNAFFDKTSIEFQSFYPSQTKDGNYFRTICLDNNDDIWFGSFWSGMYQVKEVNNKAPHFINFSLDISEVNSILDNRVIDIFPDDSDNLWVGHFSGGVDRFSTSGPGFKSYSRIIKNNFEEVHFVAIHEDSDGNVWLGENGTGLYKLSPADDKADHYPLKVFSKGNTDENSFHAIYKDSSNNDILWIGKDNGLYKFDKLSGDFTKIGINTKDEDPLNGPVRGIVFEKDWLLLSGERISVFNLRTEKLAHHNKRIIDTLPPSDVSEWALSFLFETKKGDIWLVSEHGLHQVHFDPHTGDLSFFQPANLYPEELPKRNKISTSIREDNNGLLWIATAEGLSKYNPNDSTMIRYLTQAEGFYCKIECLEIDNKGRIWCGMETGLACFNPDNKHLRIYTKRDGLPFLIHSPLGSYRCSDGKMYFTGKGGFYSFYPDSMVISKKTPEIVITNFSLFGKRIYPSDSTQSILTKRVEYTTSIKLKYNQNDISLEFAALDFTNPIKNQYSYRLDGYDNKWTRTDAKNRIATYTNLDPGNYIFRVKGSNSEGIWNEEGAMLHIQISPPFWLRWWFILSMLILFAAAIISYVRYRTLSLMRKNIELETIVQNKTEEILAQREEIDLAKNRFFANISHEFRTPITLINGSADQLSKGIRKPENSRFLSTIKRSSSQLLKLVNEILDLSKLESSKYAFKPEKADIIAIARRIWGFYLSEAERRKINFIIQVPREEFHCYYDEAIVQKVLHNLLSNALKFTKDGGGIMLSVMINQSEPTLTDEISFIVRDDGIGIPEDKIGEIFNRFYQVDHKNERISTGTGIGLALVKELVDLHKGEISVRSIKGSTTSFKFTIPCVLEKVERKKEEKGRGFQYTPQMETEPSNESVLISEYYNNQNEELVLVIEDNAELRQYITTILDKYFKVISASNGKKGFEAAKKDMPDLIVSDIMMPEMDGVELCRSIKKDPLTNHIPVVLLTARADKQSKLSGLDEGADDYIIKPFDSDELITRVKNIIRQREQLRKHFEKNLLLDNTGTDTNFPQYRMLRDIIHICDQQQSDPEFNVDLLGDKLNLSRSQLYRKVRSVTGSTPNELLRMIRMKRASQLLRKGELNVMQVMLEVGFRNQSHFAASFKKFYGVNPSEFRK